MSTSFTITLSRQQYEELDDLLRVVNSYCDEHLEDRLCDSAQAYVAFVQTFLPDTYAVIKAKRMLATALCRVDNLALAEAIYREELDYLQDRVEPNCGSLRSPLFHLANVIGAQGRESEARPLQKRAEGLSYDVGGSYQPQEELPPVLTGSMSGELLDGIVALLQAYADARKAQLGSDADAFDHLEVCRARDAALLLRQLQYNYVPGLSCPPAMPEDLVAATVACAQECLEHRGYHFGERMGLAETHFRELLRHAETCHGKYGVQVCDALLCCMAVQRARVEQSALTSAAVQQDLRDHADLLSRAQDILLTNAAQLEDVNQKGDAARLMERAEQIGKLALK